MIKRSSRLKDLTDEELNSFIYMDLESDVGREVPEMRLDDSHRIVMDDVTFRPLFKYRLICLDDFIEIVDRESGLEVESDPEAKRVVEVCFAHIPIGYRATLLVKQITDYIYSEKGE